MSVEGTTGWAKAVVEIHLDLPELGSQTATALWVCPRRPSLPPSSRVLPWCACCLKPGSATPPPFTQDGKKNENVQKKKHETLECGAHELCKDSYQ